MEMMIDRFISSQYIVKHFQSHLVFFPDLGSSMVINDLLPGAPFFFWLFSFLFLQAVVELSQFQILVDWDQYY